MGSKEIAETLCDSVNDKYANVKAWVTSVAGAYVVNGLIKTKFDNPWFFMMTVPRRGLDHDAWDTQVRQLTTSIGGLWHYSSRSLDACLGEFERKFKSFLVFNITEKVRSEIERKVVNEKSAKAWCDGACPGNPEGPMGMGGVVQVGIRKVQVMHFVPQQDGNTNNVAELMAALITMQRASQMGVEDLTLYADSKLVVETLNGNWKTHKKHLKPLIDEAHTRMEYFQKIRVVHVPRAENSEADSVANEAIRKRLSTVVSDKKASTQMAFSF